MDYSADEKRQYALSKLEEALIGVNKISNGPGKIGDRLGEFKRRGFLYTHLGEYTVLPAEAMKTYHYNSLGLRRPYVTGEGGVLNGLYDEKNDVMIIIQDFLEKAEKDDIIKTIKRLNILRGRHKSYSEDALKRKLP